MNHLLTAVKYLPFPSSFIIYYERSASSAEEKKQVLFNSTSMITGELTARKTFFLGGLTPKTFYTFSAVIYYANSADAFEWASDTQFRFETLGDVPTAPGQPVMQKGANIGWEPSKDNGAPIIEYSLEGYKTNSKRVGRSAATEPNTSAIVSSTSAPALSGMNMVEEREKINKTEEEQWTVYYTGNNSYWFAADLSDELYRFRVRARNSFGYSPFSVTSEEISHQKIINTSSYLSEKPIAIYVGVIIACCISLCLFLYIGETTRRGSHSLDRINLTLSFLSPHLFSPKAATNHQRSLYRPFDDGRGAGESQGNATRRELQQQHPLPHCSAHRHGHCSVAADQQGQGGV